MKCSNCQNEIPDDVPFCPQCGKKQLPEAASSGYEYAAFISYRHLPHDQEVAKQVQKAIETFTIPGNFAATGNAGGRIGKCFRDEDELAASHSLPERILNALENSSSLIVVCTPDTKDSIWVQREIEAFIEMHGRERIFPVLAGGSSAESIPAILRIQEEDGTHSSPLAADLRPTASAKPKDEILRIIAAIVGCGYDDLKRRNQTRRRKRMAIMTAIAIAIVAVIAGLIVFASHASDEALIAESKQLALESSELLARGDRYGAIEKALGALPASGTSHDRPLVPEAKDALIDALQIVPSQSTIWKASYEIKTKAPLGLFENSMSSINDTENTLASFIAVSDQGGFFAVSDGDGNIAVYDTFSGRKLSDCTMPEDATPLDGGLFARTMAATKDYLVVANGGFPTVLACFKAKTGEMVWDARDTGVPSFNASFGDNLLSMAFPVRTGGFAVYIADLETQSNSSANVTDVGMVDPTSSYFNTPGDRLGTNYSAFGNKLFKTELDSKEVAETELANPVVTSLAYQDGIVVAASADPMPENDIKRNYTIEAFDGDLNRIWRYDGSFISEMLRSEEITTLLTGEPVIHITADGEKGVAFNAGRDAIILSLGSGDEIFKMSFDQTVIDMLPIGESEGDTGFISISNASGIVTVKDLKEGSQDQAGDSRRLTLNFPVRWSRLIQSDTGIVALVIPADSEDRIVAYRTDWTRGDQTPADYSLDELISLAKSVLKEGGRS